MDLIQLLSSKTSGKKVAPKLDSSTAAPLAVTFAHHMIHAGNHFSASVYDTDVDTVSPKIYKLTTPDTTKWVHMVFQYSASAAGLWEVYENPTFGTSPDAGTTVTARNNNRNSANIAALVIKEDASLGSGGTANKGTLIWQEYLGSTGTPNNRIGGATGREMEFVLKQNTVYLVYFTPDADNTKADLMLIWYEHTDEE